MNYVRDTGMWTRTQISGFTYRKCLFGSRDRGKKNLGLRRNLRRTDLKRENRCFQVWLASSVTHRIKIWEDDSRLLNNRKIQIIENIQRV
jgi:hypothetical protein